jgi:two-component system, response regulator / RNA-binding antiterminator
MLSTARSGRGARAVIRGAQAPERLPPTAMSIGPPEPLRILIANERKERLARTTGLVAAMGHHVIAPGLEVSEVAAATAEAMPDVALVGLGESSEHALDLISQIVQEAACPVIAILETQDAEFVNEAAKRGVFAYVTHRAPEELQGAVDIVLRRFAEFHRLEGALGRRALTERAKGILMERHRIDEREAFELLRSHSRRTGRKLIDVAEAVSISHLLLAAEIAPGSDNSRPADPA